jgi:hypothetical protein
MPNPGASGVARWDRLLIADFQLLDGGLALRLGDDLVPVPASVIVLVEQLIGQPHNLPAPVIRTANGSFPAAVQQLAERLNRHGVTRAARVAALDALLTTVPAPVLAQLLDRRPWRVADRSKILGKDWRCYVALRVQS